MESKESVIPGKLTVVIPVYNGEKSIAKLIRLINDQLAPRVDHLEVVTVNDGSPDNSAGQIASCMDLPDIELKYIELMTNFGEHNAVMCGLNHATGDYVAIIDDDFQNPPSEILLLTNSLIEGNFDVVYSYYEEKKHHWFRNLGSKFNDMVATIMLKKPKNLYLSSFKVLSKDLVRCVVRYDGPYPYIDGIIFSITKKVGTQLARHEHREEGRSNYTLARLFKLWLNMFTGYSIAPLRIASILGLILSALTPLLIAFYIYSYFQGGVFVHKVIPPGWASLIILVNFFGGMQLLVLGLTGEYLGRLFLTVNKKPQFLIRKTLSNTNEGSSRAI